MILAWSDLSPQQRELITVLATPFPPGDDIGVEIDEISPHLLSSAGSLGVLGLLTKHYGWQGTVWLRLTTAGREIKGGLRG